MLKKSKEKKQKESLKVSRVKGEPKTIGVAAET